jgi:hypothetical protein
VREATNGGDVLDGVIEISAGVSRGESSATTLGIISSTSSDAVDLLVTIYTVMVSILTSARNGGLNVLWMPSTNTSNLAKTFVSLARKTRGTPTGSNTLKSLSFGDGDGIDHLVLSKDTRNGDGLLKEILGKVDLISGSTTVDLNLHDVSLLEAERKELGLSVSDEAHNWAVLDDASNFGLKVLLASLGGSLTGVAGEGLPLGAVPVLVEATKNGLGQMLGPDGGKGTKTVGSLNVTNNTNSDHGRCLKDCHGFDDLLLVELGAGVINSTDNVGHTSLVGKESSKMRRLAGVIDGE